MIGAAILGVVGVASVLLGCKGFSKDGIPWSSKTNITGQKAKVIGIACIAFGVLSFLIALFTLIVQAGRYD